jgi:hypothetical protein
MHVQNRATWILTGNNPSFSQELVRRMVQIHIDPRVAQPWERSGFRIPYLLRWVKQQRSRLVDAALTMINAWIMAGRPAYTGKVLGSFEHYSETLGGILQHAGVEGFMGGREQMEQQTNPVEEEWRVLVNAWAHADSGRPTQSESTSRTRQRTRTNHPHRQQKPPEPMCPAEQDTRRPRRPRVRVVAP